MTGHSFALKLKEYLSSSHFRKSQLYTSNSIFHPETTSSSSATNLSETSEESKSNSGDRTLVESDGGKKKTQNGGLLSSIGKIEANPEQSKSLETATASLFGLSLDFVNLRKEVYENGSRIPIMVRVCSSMRCSQAQISYSNHSLLFLVCSWKLNSSLTEIFSQCFYSFTTGYFSSLFLSLFTVVWNSRRRRFEERPDDQCFTLQRSYQRSRRLDWKGKLLKYGEMTLLFHSTVLTHFRLFFGLLLPFLLAPALSRRDYPISQIISFELLYLH